MSLKFKLEAIDPGEFLIMALDLEGRTIKGTYSFSVEDHDKDGTKLVRGGVFVPERFRGKGIGRRLIHRFVDEVSDMTRKASKDHIHLVVFESPTSERRLLPVYTELGYTPFTSRKGKSNAVKQYLAS